MMPNRPAPSPEPKHKLAISEILDHVEARIEGIDILKATPAEKRTENAQDKYLEQARFELWLIKEMIDPTPEPQEGKHK